MTTLFGEQINTLNVDKINSHLANGEYNSLSDVELIYTIVGSEEIAGRVFQTSGKDLNSLFKFSISELMRVPGMTKKKSAALVAAMEMGRRKSLNAPKSRSVVRCSNDGYQLMYPILADLQHEELWIILLNRSAKVLEKICMSKGGSGETSADIPMIIRKVLEHGATGVILSHNHPSGNTQPSLSDDRLTHKLYKAAKLLDISLLDHVIVCDGSYYSYADEGKLIPANSNL